MISVKYSVPLLLRGYSLKDQGGSYFFYLLLTLSQASCSVTSTIFMSLFHSTLILSVISFHHSPASQLHPQHLQSSFSTISPQRTTKRLQTKYVKKKEDRN